MLEYDGPVALSCDNTNLLAAFCPYYDWELDGFYMIGHVREPYQITDVEAFCEVTESGILEKVTKV